MRCFACQHILSQNRAKHENFTKVNAANTESTGKVKSSHTSANCDTKTIASSHCYFIYLFQTEHAGGQIRATEASKKKDNRTLAYMYFNPIAFRMAKTLWSFDHSECNRVKTYWNGKE